MDRRSFLGGLITALAMPAIVHAGNLMLVRSLELELVLPLRGTDWDELVAITRRVFVPRMYVQLYASTPLVRTLELMDHSDLPLPAAGDLAHLVTVPALQG